MKLLTKLFNKTISWLIVGLRPLLGPALCYYEIGCSSYALQCLETQSFIPAMWLIAKRLASCNPITMWSAFFKKSFFMVTLLLITLPHITYTTSSLATEDISVNECNPESLRSKELLLQLVSVIKETCKLMHLNFEPKISATAHGLSVMCEIEQPRTYIVLVTENDTKTVHCSIITKDFSKKQKKLIEQTMIKLFCSKSL